MYAPDLSIGRCLKLRLGYVSCRVVTFALPFVQGGDWTLLRSVLVYSGR